MLKYFFLYFITFFQDDFLLRHYDKGPCKNKLGHSRASVLWHRAQVILRLFFFYYLIILLNFYGRIIF